MKKGSLLRVNLIISAIIASAFCAVLFINYNTHRVLLKDDIQNISKLASSTIYAGINDELTKPLYVSQTMANDTFLKTWMHGERANLEDPAYLGEIERYLYTLKNKYGYDTAYVISAQTGTYYYYDGINKVVGQNDRHDKWYFSLIESGESHVLNIDEDEVHNGDLTLFVDSRMEDADGNLLGVTGVGFRISTIQELLQSFESEYALQAYLIRADGNVSIHTDTSRIGQANVFDEHADKSLREHVLQGQDEMRMRWLSEGTLSSCVISRYISNLDWYLIVEKDTGPLYRSFQNMLTQDLLAGTIALLALLILSTLIIRNYQRTIHEQSQLDALTGLYNREYLKDFFARRQKKWLAAGATFFLFDIDHFKTVNDTHGHLMGNTVLSAVGALIRKELGEKGLAVRWGGDEFAGILPLPLEDAIGLLERVRTGVSSLSFDMDTPVSISIGVVEAQPGDTAELLLKRADQALYASKDQGRNRISRYREQA